MRTSAFVFGAVAAASASVALACVPQPKVVATSVPNGATNVDPALDKLSFTFDHDMARDGWSVVKTSGGQTPEIVGKPAFSKDGRTVTLSVKLKPGRRYDLLLNGGRYWNFRSSHGATAESYHFSFTTAG